MTKQSSLFMLAMFYIASCGSIDTPISPLPRSTVYGKLSNGFSYYLHYCKGAAIEAHLLVKVGSNQETEDEKQLAHLLEHAAMNRTKNFESPKKFFQESGLKIGADFNAMTGDNSTDYWMKIPRKDELLLRSVIKFFKDCASEIVINDHESEVIRSAVLEESRAQGAAGTIREVRQVLMGQTTFSESYRKDAANAVRNFSQSSLIEFYRKWYRPDTQAITIVGDFDLEQADKQIRSIFSNLLPSPGPKVASDYLDTSFFRWQNQIKVIYSKHENSDEHAKLYIKLPNRTIVSPNDYDFYLTTVLYNRLIKRRYQQIEPELPIPFMRTPPLYDYLFEIDGPDFDIISCDFSFKESQLKQNLKRVLVELERIRRFGFSEEEFEQAVQEIAQDETLFQKDNVFTYSQKLKVHFVSMQAVYDGDTYEKIFRKKLHGKSLTELNTEISQWLTLGKNFDLVLFKSSNSKNQLSFDTVRRMYREIVRGSIDPPISTKPVKAIHHKELLSRRAFRDLVPDKEINISRRFGESKITILRLANGIEFYLKETSHLNSKVVSLNSTTVSINRPNTITLDYRTAESLSAIANSGLGQLNAIELSAYYKEHGIEWAKVHSTYSGIEFTSRFAKSSLEKVLQVAYLYMTNPKLDTASRHFRNSNNKTEFGQNAIAAKKLIDVFTNDFSATSGRKFILVGAFDEEQAISLIIRYFGSIPKRIRSVNLLNDEPVKLPRVEQNKQVDSSGICHVRLTISNNLSISVSTRISLEVISNYMQIRLLERLREKEKGVYSVSTIVSTDKKTSDHYIFQIAFSCAPSVVARLVKSVHDEIGYLKQNHIPSNVVQNILKAMTENISERLASSDFWLTYIEQQLIDGRSLDEVYEELEATKKWQMVSDEVSLLLQTEIDPSLMREVVTFS